MAPRKAVIPIAGLGTRFLPLSKILPKELWPLVDKPVLQYIVEEALFSGIKEIIFVSRPEKKLILDYFNKYLKKNYQLEKVLKSRKKNNLLKEVKDLERISKKISFSLVTQKRPWGDGHAVLQAEKIVKKEPFAVLFGDDVVESKIPCLLQLLQVFKKYQKPVLALNALPKEKLSSYGIVKIKKIKKNIYQIKDIVEKPKAGKAPSSLAVVGKYILTPDIFNYLRKVKKNQAQEIILAEGLRGMIRAGKKILGVKFEGKWLECGNKPAYLKSNLYLCLKHPQFGKDLKKFLRA